MGYLYYHRFFCDFRRFYRFLQIKSIKKIKNQLIFAVFCFDFKKLNYCINWLVSYQPVFWPQKTKPTVARHEASISCYREILARPVRKKKYKKTFFLKVYSREYTLRTQRGLFSIFWHDLCRNRVGRSCVKTRLFSIF